MEFHWIWAQKELERQNCWQNPMLKPPIADVFVFCGGLVGLAKGHIKWTMKSRWSSPAQDHQKNVQETKTDGRRTHIYKLIPVPWTFFSIWGPDNLEYPVSLFQRNVEFLNDIIMGCQGLPGTRNIFFCIASKKSIGPLVPLRWPAFYYTSFLVVVAAANGSCNKTANTRANLGFRIWKRPFRKNPMNQTVATPSWWIMRTEAGESLLTHQN